MQKNVILQKLHFDTYDPTIGSDIDEFEKAILFRRIVVINGLGRGQRNGAAVA